MPEREIAHQGIVGRIYKNLGMLLGGKAAAGIISLSYGVIAARVLGPEQYGILVLINYFAMLIGGLIAFPGWHAIVRYGVSLMAGQHYDKLVRLLRFTGAIEIGFGVLAVLAAAILAPIVGPELGWSPRAQMLALPYSLAVLATVRATPGGFLQIIRRFDLIGAHSVVTPIMRLLGTLIVVYLGLGLNGFIIAWLAAALAECVSLWAIGIYQARKTMRGAALWGPVNDVRHEHDGLLRFMSTANLDIMLADVVSRLTPLVMGWVLGPAAAGLFSVALRTTVVIAQPAQILGQAAYAEFARLIGAGGSGADLRGAILKAIGIALLSALPLILILAFFSKQIAVLIYGPAYAGAAIIMIWLALAKMIAMANPPLSAGLIALGKPGSSVLSNLIANIGLLPLLLIFTHSYGLIGAGAHALLQAVCGMALLSFFVFRATRHPAA